MHNERASWELSPLQPASLESIKATSCMLRLSFVFSCAGIFWGFGDTYCPLLVNAQNDKGVNQGVEPRGDVTDVNSLLLFHS